MSVSAQHAPHALYRMFAANDSLLYVGLTCNPTRRMQKHSADKPWWSDVARIEMEQFPDRESVIAAERAVIESEKPLHNIRMNRSGTRSNLTESGWSRLGPNTWRSPDSGDKGHYTTAAARAKHSKTAFDGLVGRWFHTWEEHTDEDERRVPASHRHMRGDRHAVWQGQIVAREGDGLYVAQLYSWWDGEPTNEVIIDLAALREATLYASAEKMQIALGCSEHFSAHKADFRDGKCGNPATHRTSVGNYVCWKCAGFYSSAKEVAA